MRIKIREDEQELYRHLNETGISIGVIVEGPHAFPCYFDPASTPENCTTPGLGIELTQAICQVLVLPCWFIPVNHTTYGSTDPDTGEWVGMIQEVRDGLYDTSLPVFNPTPARAEVVAFSYPVYSETNLLVSLFPSIETFKTGAVLFAISLPVWALIFGAVLVMGLLFAVFQISGKPGSVRRFCSSCLRNTFDAVAILTNQDLQPLPSSASMRTANYVVLAFWGLACVVLAGMYSSQIVATALDYNLELPFKGLSSLAKCVSRFRCQMSTTSIHTSYYDRIYNSVEGPLSDLKKALDVNPPRIVKNSSSRGIMDFPEESQAMVLYGSSSTYASLIKKFPPCSFDGVEVQSFDPVAMPLPFGNRIGPLLNRAITVVRETGIVSRLYSKYTGKYIKGQDRCKVVETFAEPMPLKAFVGAFFLLLAGAVAAMSSLLGEKGVRAWRKKHL